MDLTATQIAATSKLNINTVDKYLFGLRQCIAEYCECESPFKGDVEVDVNDDDNLAVQGVGGIALGDGDTVTLEIGGDSDSYNAHVIATVEGNLEIEITIVGE